MKVTYRIPTADPYAFVEIEMNVDQDNSPPENIKNQYDQFTQSFKQKPTEMPQQEWNKCLENYVNDKGMSEESMHRLSERQNWMIHELDKLFSRLDAKK